MNVGKSNRQAKRYATIVACPSGRLAANKREIKDFPKLPSATSFIAKRYTKWRLKSP